MKNIKCDKHKFFVWETQYFMIFFKYAFLKSKSLKVCYKLDHNYVSFKTLEFWL